LAVARAQFELPFGFRRRAVGQIGVGRLLGLQILDRLAALAKDHFFPRDQLAAKIFALPFVHEWLFVGRLVTVRQLGRHAHSFA
jgi:hypothetical protein